MRGKDNSRCNTDIIHRITPAYAGKSGINCNQIPVTGDHPRLCGEKSGVLPVAFPLPGSPPPMRGKGIIPVNVLRGSTDHPRLCGEKVLEMMRKLRGLGSPPPMRGKVKKFPWCAPIVRITPAYAGKRRTSSILLLAA